MVDTINPNITAGIGGQGQQINPLAMVGQFAQTQNALNQNALFQQTFRARQALGPLAQQAMGSDGQMDWAKYGVLVSTHPDTAFMAPEILNQIAQKKLVDAETMNAELTGYEKRMGITSQLAAAAYKNPDVKEGKDLTSTASDMLAAGGIKDGNRQDLISWLTQMAPLKGTELKQRLAQFAQTHEAGRKALSDINGQYKPDLYYTPQGDKVGGWVSTVTGQAAPAGGFGAAAAPTAPQPSGTPATSAAPSTPGVAGAGLQLGEVGQMRTEQLKQVADYRNEVGDRANRTANLVAQLNIAQRYARAVETGKFADVRTDLANTMRSLNFSPEIYNAVGNGSLADSQALMKQFMNNAIGGIAQIVHSAAAGSKLGQQETLMYMAKGAPNIEMTPQGISKVIAAAKEVANYSHLENEYVKTKMSQRGYDPVNVMNDWPSVYNSLVERRQ
jgi:hypothetical protein